MRLPSKFTKIIPIYINSLSTDWGIYLKDFFINICVILVCFITPAQASKQLKLLPFHKSIESDLDVKKSPYYFKTLEVIKAWNTLKPKVCTEAKHGVHVKAWTLPEHELYVGVGQIACISSPIDSVSQLILDFSGYAKLFPALNEVKITEKKDNQYLTHWSAKVPLFFIPDFEYQMLYLIENDKPDRKIFRYHLKQGEKIKASDGVVILQKLSDYLTLYFEIDFYDADWGILKTISTDTIWNESIKGLFHSDLALKFKAENSSWSSEKALNESEKKVNKISFDLIIQKREPFKGIDSIRTWLKSLN